MDCETPKLKQRKQYTVVWWYHVYITHKCSSTLLCRPALQTVSWAWAVAGAFGCVPTLTPAPVTAIGTAPELLVMALRTMLMPMRLATLTLPVRLASLALVVSPVLAASLILVVVAHVADNISLGG